MSKQISLFGNAAVDAGSNLGRVLVCEEIKREKTANGKDKNGKAKFKPARDVLVLDFLPKRADEGEASMQALFPQHKGQSLMAFDSSVRREAAEVMVRELASRIVTGEYVLGRTRFNRLNGEIRPVFKRAKVQVVAEVSESAALAKLGLTAEQVKTLKQASLSV